MLLVKRSLDWLSTIIITSVSVVVSIGLYQILSQDHVPGADDVHCELKLYFGAKIFSSAAILHHLYLCSHLFVSDIHVLHICCMPLF